MKNLKLFAPVLVVILFVLVICFSLTTDYEMERTIIELPDFEVEK